MSEEQSLDGRLVVIMGRLASMARRDAEALIRSRGGLPQDAVSRRTDVLVVGADGLPLAADGGISKKLRRAREFREAGHDVEIIEEDELLRRMGLAPEECLYTTAQLGRVLGIPGSRIRSWVRRGLIRPVRTVHRLGYFELRQAAALRTLDSLVDGGVTPERIRRSLGRVARWCPGSGEVLARLRIEDGDLLVRLDDGGAAEPGGQLRLGFDIAEPGTPVAGPSGGTDWFDEGLRREDAGEPEAAVAAYERALVEDGPDPETCFNLGNVLFGLGWSEQAEVRFRQALELDPEYVEASNNLGNALAERGEREEAATAFERALALAPDYADAHFNLAETLHAMGETGRARPHWEAYLAQDARSGWADRARSRLRN